MTAPKKPAQRNGGRRAIDGSTKVRRVTITLTDDDHQKLRRVGGSPWVRRKLREENPT